MSKSSLYLVAAFALAATGATFLVTKPSAKVTCSRVVYGDATESFANPTATILANPLTHATMHGFPLWYYEEPLPADCVSHDNPGAGVISTFNTVHLGYDLLIWAAVALLLFVPSAAYKWWRGPAMLGDKARRV